MLSIKTHVHRSAILKVGIAFLVIISVGIMLWSKYKAHDASAVRNTMNDSDVLVIGGTPFQAEIVDTPLFRQRGLSGRSHIGDTEAMLFVFPQSDYHGFWMKDMLFPIDILWLTEEGVIVHIKESARPESYPEPFVPQVPARVVIEVKEGTVKAYKLKIGDSLIFNKNILKNASN